MEGNKDCEPQNQGKFTGEIHRKLSPNENENVKLPKLPSQLTEDKLEMRRAYQRQYYYRKKTTDEKRQKRRENLTEEEKEDLRARSRRYWANAPKEQRERIKARKKEAYSKITLEQREIRNARQREKWALSTEQQKEKKRVYGRAYLSTKATEEQRQRVRAYQIKYHQKRKLALIKPPSTPRNELGIIDIEIKELEARIADEHNIDADGKKQLQKMLREKRLERRKTLHQPSPVVSPQGEIEDTDYRANGNGHLTSNMIIERLETNVGITAEEIDEPDHFEACEDWKVRIKMEDSDKE